MAATLNLVAQLPSAEFWYVHSNGATFGPFTLAQMDELGKQGRLGPQTMVVAAGDTNWLALSSYLPVQETIRTPTSSELDALVGVAPLSRTAVAVQETAEVPWTFESLISSMPQTSSQKLGPGNQVGCAICRSTPVRQFVFAQNISTVIRSRLETSTGTFCRPCAKAKGRRIQSLTILTGWWGTIALFFNIWVILCNTTELWKAGRMDKPEGSNPSRLPIGLPVIFRPASIGFFVLALLFYFFRRWADGEG